MLNCCNVKFGLDQPAPVRYFRWVSGIVTRGYWGRSLQWNKPVHEILAERVPMTIMISLMALIFLLGDRHSIGHLFGDPPVFAAGLHHYIYWVCGDSNARLLAWR